MKVSLFVLSIGSTSAFGPVGFGVTPRASRSATTCLQMAEIRGPTEKSKELRFGWDGTTALGGAVVDSQPARMLEDIRAVGETIPDECEVFNANVEMDSGDLKFEDENGLWNWVSVEDRSLAVNAFMVNARRYAEKAPFMQDANKSIEEKLTSILESHGKIVDVRYEGDATLPSFE